MNASPIITVHDVSKTFCTWRRTDGTLLSRIADILPSGSKRHIQPDVSALRDINLEVSRGEVLGIVGRNGSGKTTLLRIIAGILKPDTGTVLVQGAVTSLISLSVGLQHRLTVRDNIFLSGSLYGLRRSQSLNAFDSIVEFGELEPYLDRYVYQLSAGYIQRLAFSIAIFSNPEILILDEVFSAGDEHFQRKAKQRMRSIVQSNDVTVLMVSHKSEHILDMCDRALWLENGQMQAIGTPEHVTHIYAQAQSPESLIAHH